MDEPVERGFSIAGVKDYIISQGCSSEFWISGYKRGYALQVFVQSSSVDKVLFSSYKHWWEFLPGIWVSCCPVNWDQRSDWSDMKNLFPTKSVSNWIGAHLELGEYTDLFGHAKNLNLQTIWFYQYQDPTDDYSDNNIWQFCSSAWYQGYLRRFSERVKYEYKCDFANSELCQEFCDENDPTVWQLHRVIHYGELREDFPMYD